MESLLKRRRTMGKIKTDNHSPAAKLELRRYFLHKYHAKKPPDVLDCCQGGGLLWGQLRKEFVVASYWGLDLKPRKGRLKLDSVRVLTQSGWPQNVVDIDTYGSPWKHWFAMLPNITQPTTVFLTISQLVTGTVGAISKEAISAVGLGRLRIKLPAGFHPKLVELATASWLTSVGTYGLELIEAIEAASTNKNVRYVGLRLEPIRK